MRTVSGCLLLAMLISACGGGGADTPQPGPEPTPGPPPDPVPTPLSLSGTLLPAGDAAIDSDTGDPTVPAISNNFTDTPQEIRNPVTVGGHTTLLNDEFDVFRVDLAAGQAINLFIAEDGAENDLDLVLADLDRNVLAASVETGKFESINVPGSGTAGYFIQVNAFSGASNYVLTITQPDSGGDATARPLLHTRTEFVPDQLIVRYTDSTAGSAMPPGTGRK